MSDPRDFAYGVRRYALWARLPADQRAVSLDSLFGAERFLLRRFGDERSLRALRTELAACGEQSVSSMTNDEVRARAAARLRNGSLRALRVPIVRMRAPIGEEVAPASDPSVLGPVSEIDEAWIEFEVLDELGKPVVGEPYELTLPDGTTRKGTLDGDGMARVDSIDPGTCTIRFPKRDQLDWDPSLDRYDHAKPTWVELELLDADGTPCADEPFVVHCADGRKIKGKLDENGQARVEDLVADMCSIELTERDWRDVEPAGR